MLFHPGVELVYLLLDSLLLALLSVGIGSTLGTDDFLVAFFAGYGFSRDGWFYRKTKATDLQETIDLLLNSAMFVYLGTIIPWHSFQAHSITPLVTPARLIAFLVLVLLFRRIPIILGIYPWIKDIKTIREALFCGHFGPMGLGALFLAMEAYPLAAHLRFWQVTRAPMAAAAAAAEEVQMAAHRAQAVFLDEFANLWSHGGSLEAHLREYH